MIKYSIKDLERITGIRAHTIRIWEKRYGIVEPARTLTNIRYYSDEDLRHLMNVAILNKYGYKISNIRSMSGEEISRCVVDLTSQDTDNSHQVDNLIMSMMEMDEQRFNKIITSSIIKHGFDYTFETLLHVFLEKTGILWQIGTIIPAQEHFITQLIRQKLILAIDGLSQLKNGYKTFVLFLPENEFHELGLLYLNFIIRKAGHQVIYLGQNVPAENLSTVFDLHTVDYLLTSFTAGKEKETVTLFLEEVSKISGGKQILIGGNIIQGLVETLPSNIRHFDSANSFADYLTQI